MTSDLQHPGPGNPRDCGRGNQRPGQLSGNLVFGGIPPVCPAAGRKPGALFFGGFGAVRGKRTVLLRRGDGSCCLGLPGPGSFRRRRSGGGEFGADSGAAGLGGADGPGDGTGEGHRRGKRGENGQPDLKPGHGCTAPARFRLQGADGICPRFGERRPDPGKRLL